MDYTYLLFIAPQIRICQYIYPNYDYIIQYTTIIIAMPVIIIAIY